MLTLREFLVREPLPLHQVHQAIFEFCRGRTDAVIFGAQAVNAHVVEPRMTQDVDILSPAPEALAAELAAALKARFSTAVRIREVAPGKGWRLYQKHRDGPRHLADVRRLDFELTEVVEREGVRYVPAAVLAAMKVRAMVRRAAAPKGLIDCAYLIRILFANPGLREGTAVRQALSLIGAEPEALAAWDELLRVPLVSDAEADEGY